MVGAVLCIAAPVQAQNFPEGFTTGPVFTEYGPVADVDADMELPADTELKVAFDLSEKAATGELNRGLQSAARFINMHARAGVPEDRISVALVVHGAAGNDLLHDAAYGERYSGAANVNLPLIAALLEHGVDIYICGQSAAGMGIAKEDLAPGIKVALSAMTAHALLQQQGYTLNPF
jgi:intracellular sulfur oxidation DsrE/DsrF family protein